MNSRTRPTLIPEKTEFYDVAVRAGFYGREEPGLYGKSDNVRKFWEDMSIKLCLRPVVEEVLQRKERVRIVDLGSGSGQGYELLTHLPVRAETPLRDREFLLSDRDIDLYAGLDISEGMVTQGRTNYAGKENVRFRIADLSEGWPLPDEPPFDLYFSSYGSLSHLSAEQLSLLFAQICRHVDDRAYFVFDVLGRFSPEWPKYWRVRDPEVLPYNMAYLQLPHERTADNITWFPCSFWSAAEIRSTLELAARGTGVSLEFTTIRDRSLLVGRHMETGIFNGSPRPWRSQVNRLLDDGYRGQIDLLRVNLEPFASRGSGVPLMWQRLCDYASRWNTIMGLLSALTEEDNDGVRGLIEGAPPDLADDLKMLAWLCRNSGRFPVADPWASVIGPQTAMVLRNQELSLGDALGCGHALFGVVEIRKGAPVSPAVETLVACPYPLVV